MTPLTITLAVCEVFGVTVDELKSKSRSRLVATARTAAMALSWQAKEPGESMSAVGARFGKVGWTVHYALKRHENFLKVNPVYREDVEMVKGMLK